MVRPLTVTGNWAVRMNVAAAPGLVLEVAVTVMPPDANCAQHRVLDPDQSVGIGDRRNIVELDRVGWRCGPRNILAHQRIPARILDFGHQRLQRRASQSNGLIAAADHPDSAHLRLRNAESSEPLSKLVSGGGSAVPAADN
jgi:hypothetical protein